MILKWEGGGEKDTDNHWIFLTKVTLKKKMAGLLNAIQKAHVAFHLAKVYGIQVVQIASIHMVQKYGNYRLIRKLRAVFHFFRMGTTIKSVRV